MISAIVIVASVALAAVFTLAWLLSRGLREEIERPKHSFQEQLRRYDRQCGNHRPATGRDRKQARGRKTRTEDPGRNTRTEDEGVEE